MAAKYLYGPVPGEPDETTGAVTGGNVSMTVKVGEKTESFAATISGSGSVIALKLSGGIYPVGSKTLALANGFEDKIKSLFGFDELNPNIASGWMLDRVMEVLEQNPGSGHDPTKMMVSGCSGCGKGAYLAGVFSRVPLTVVVESGGGGVSNLRQAVWFRYGEGGSIWQCASGKPESIDTVADEGECAPWMTSAARYFRDNPSKVFNLPLDTHLILATIAPRYLVVFTNSNGPNEWCELCGTCEALSAWAAKPVWKALGVPERMGFGMYSALHCGASGSQTTLASEMFKRVFEGDATANTDVMNVLMNGVQQPFNEWKDLWIDWDMDVVLQ